MKVSELIKILSQMNQDSLVTTDTYGSYNSASSVVETKLFLQVETDKVFDAQGYQYPTTEEYKKNHPNVPYKTIFDIVHIQ